MEATVEGGPPSELRRVGSANGLTRSRVTAPDPAPPAVLIGYMIFRRAAEGLIDSWRQANGHASKADVGQ